MFLNKAKKKWFLLWIHEETSKYNMCCFGYQEVEREK